MQQDGLAINTKVSLDLRGQRLSLEREALMELPESVLLCLFPNGVVLSPQRQPRLEGEDADGNDDGEDVYYVDVSSQSCTEIPYECRRRAGIAGML